MFGQLVDVALISKCQDIQFPVDLFLSRSLCTSVIIHECQLLLTHQTSESHHMCVYTLILSSPFTGDNNTVVYLEEVPLQAFPMFQGTTKHILPSSKCYISDLLLRVGLICRRVMEKWEGLV